MLFPILEIYGSYIEGSQILFGDHSDKYILAQVYNDGTDDVGVTFDGSGYVRFQPQEQFIVNNLASDGTNSYNSLVMNKQGNYSQPYILLGNNDDFNNYLRANLLQMDAHYYASSSPNNYYNRIMLRNNATASGTSYTANYLLMSAYASSNETALRNFQIASEIGRAHV